MELGALYNIALAYLWPENNGNRWLKVPEGVSKHKTQVLSVRHGSKHKLYLAAIWMTVSEECKLGSIKKDMQK